ncbi:endo-1,4-beta-xylanase [Microbulbifer halophilus]|uniref:Endo-1,4-beta-xylanase n=1 Tax=Microbulbifer halophilus TaxID=453963 RepID=A0ABW5EEL8_9GAMM|nr:endo-1,4-beta-xylanase [Microbulbifer halophilus]MCW8126553.1 endo-1,4-beta-xylanase [Microbulbifer halophilus]
MELKKTTLSFLPLADGRGNLMFTVTGVKILLKAAFTAFLVSVSAICSADNPLVSQIYTADPAARVFDGRMYVITTHDQDDQSDYSDLHDYTMFSSDDMVNWQDHGVVFDSRTDTDWANLAYAPDIIERNGQYYLYFPDGASSIGVAVSDSPTGPFTDPLGGPLVDRNTPNANVDWVFDPGVFIDDDGQAYLYFGGGGPGNARVIRLNDDMISTSGAAITLDVPNFFEALYMHKRNGTYYLSYSTNNEAGLAIDYMTSNSPISGFVHRGTVLPNPWENNNNNNHQSILSFENQWYIFYHNRAVANARGASTYQRSINSDRLFYNGDGSIQQVNAGSAGVPKLKNVDPFARNEAETIDNEQGIETEGPATGTRNLAFIENGDWVKVSNVDFGSGATGFEAGVASDTDGGTIEIVLDDVNNAPVGNLSVGNTGGWQSWQTLSTGIDTVTGVHDLFLRFSGGSDYLLNLDWYRFTGGAVEGSTLEVELESLSGQGGFSPFNVEFDSAASGGQYIAWPNNGTQILDSPADGETGQIEIPFTLSQVADVQFQIRANLPNADDDSFYYKLDSGSWVTQNNTATSGWDTLMPATFDNLSMGEHTLRVLRREDGAGLDRVELTASAGEITTSGSGGDDTVVVRALGTTGSESITLRVGGTDVQSWTLSTAMADYTATTELSGDVTVAFTNDNDDADVRIDYVEVNGQVRQAEDRSENTGAWGNDQCGGGSNSEWLHCNGYINFGPLSGIDPDPSPTGFFVGNITTGGQVRSDFMQYWGQITPENEGKWSSVEGVRDQYNWSGLDAAYNFAQQNGIPFKQHTFVWGSQSPDWINDLSPSEQAAEIEEWIRDYCARYPDTQMIDVVNEATPGHAPAGYAQSAFGNDWIIRSFELARQYCPDAILILNDYNVLSWNTQEFIDMARPAVEAGVVDAIGLQAHGLEDWSLNDVQSKLDAVAALGLPIYISEYDVDHADDQIQLQIMQEQFPMFFSHPSVAGITLWGYVVGGTWVPNSGLIRSDGSHRPAMTWLMNFLER